LRMKVAGPFKIRPYLPRFILDSSRWYLCAREMRVPLVSVWRLGSRVLSASCVVGASARSGQAAGACLVPGASRSPLVPRRQETVERLSGLGAAQHVRPQLHTPARAPRHRTAHGARESLRQAAVRGGGCGVAWTHLSWGGGVRFRTKRHDIALRMIPYRPCGHRSCDIVHREINCRYENCDITHRTKVISSTSRHVATRAQAQTANSLLCDITVFVAVISFPVYDIAAAMSTRPV